MPCGAVAYPRGIDKAVFSRYAPSVKSIIKTIILIVGFAAGISVPVFSLEGQWPSAEEYVEKSAEESMDNISTKHSETPAGAITFDLLVSVTWPSAIDITDRISVDRFAFSFGIGYHFNIINRILSPGLYLDYGFGGPIIIFANSSSDVAVAYDGYGSVGLRVYNLFTAAQFGLKPFFGFSFIGNAEIKKQNEVLYEGFGLWSWTAGVMFTHNYYGFEYAFCVPDYNNIIPFPYKYYHRISLLFHFL
jgi:hypothetical protein